MAKPYTIEELKSKTKLDPMTDCWIWSGRTHYGYGRVNYKRKLWQAHRLFYTLFVGHIHQGHEIDHVCHNRACVNPEHLEQVTHTENMIRASGFAGINASKKECVRGHPLRGDNVYSYTTKQRLCRECQKIRGREWYWRHKGFHYNWKTNQVTDVTKVSF
jgi:hypothetical protein